MAGGAINYVAAGCGQIPEDGMCRSGSENTLPAGGAREFELKALVSSAMSRAGGAGGAAGLAGALRRVRGAPALVRSRALQELATLVLEGGALATRQLVEQTHALLDMELALHVYTVLSQALMHSRAHYQAIVSCSETYEMSYHLLSKGHPDKTAVVLKFLTCLVYSEADGEQALAQHARNMIRITGCLTMMIQFFLGNFMYTETWQALCLCLAECCRGADLNQSHCSHLVPICVEKWHRKAGTAGQGPVLGLLQALLDKHPNNKELFLRSRGLDIFTRESLCRCDGAQLLHALVEGSPTSAHAVFQAGVPQTLVQLIKIHDSDSPVEQWCSICLYEITTGLKSLAASGESDRKDLHIYQEQLNIIQPDTDNDNRISLNGEDNDNFLKITNDIITISKNQKQNDSLIISNRCPLIQKSPQILNTSGQGILLNKHHYRSQLPFYHRHRENLTFTNENTTYRSKDKDRDVHSVLSGPGTTDTFTGSSMMHAVRPTRMSSYSQTTKSSFVTGVARNQFDRMAINTLESKSCQTDLDKTTHLDVTKTEQESGFREFSPGVTSTPRKVNDSLHRNIYRTRRAMRKVQNVQPKHSHEHNTRYNLQQNPKSINKPNKSSIKINKKQSLGSKWFNSLNASCTSVIQSVKNYVLPGNEKTTSDNSTRSVIDSNPSNQSFTKFFSKKYRYKCGNAHRILSRPTDTEVTNKVELYDYSSEKSDAGHDCQTCNDTVLLKRKLADNDYLKDTVTKLKLGINTYGCNFKKIAKALWPKEAYMTPMVLYNLYQKLILKK